MPWDGKERRTPDNIVEGSLTDRETRKLRRRYRWNIFIDQMFEKRYILSLIIMTQFLLLGLMSYGIVNTNNKAAIGIGETKSISEFISQFVQVSSQAGAQRNNNIADGLDCLTQVLVVPAEERTQPQIDRCRKFFQDAHVKPPTKEEVDAFLKQLKRDGKD